MEIRWCKHEWEVELAGVVKEREISLRSCYLSLDRICSREFGSVLTSQVMAVLS